MILGLAGQLVPLPWSRFWHPGFTPTIRTAPETPPNALDCICEGVPPDCRRVMLVGTDGNSLVHVRLPGP